MGTNNRLIIYDTKLPDRFHPQEGDCLFCADSSVHHCMGCFGCWVKTPGQCVIKDSASDLPRLITESREVSIISPILYGGFSKNIKSALDRSIGYILPYFRIIDGEMHHQLRASYSFKLTVCFYGLCGEKEKELAKKLVKANAVNFGAQSQEVFFFDTPEEAAERTAK